jgi:hypothetical protein
MRTKPKPVMGVNAPGPRVTPCAIWLLVRMIGLPVLGALVLLDVVIWLLADAIWDVCVGVWCWF